MIKLRKLSLYYFARNRIRREIQFDPKLRDYTNQQQIKNQTNQMRQKFEQIPTDKFSSILNDPNPKLGKRFFVQKQSLNKKLAEVYRKDIDRQSVQTHDQTDLQYLDASKSQLNDQTKQIQFEQKFQQQLFRAKQTRRLIGKKQKNINNYLPEKDKDQKYLQYEQAKKHLKNKKINNMMKMNRNNQQLELLIQSGLFNNPQNIKSVINQITKQKQPLIQSQNTISFSNNSKQNYHSQASTQLINPQIQPRLAQSLTDIGPQPLKQRAKIQQFIHNFEQQHEKDKQSCIQDLNLLKQIREYEQQVFLSRYDSINFRFKGKVNFDFFKQNQLISYIKNQKIQPKDLLLMYKQNENKISKFKLPIITPPVMSTIYSKTSLYVFPQSQTNNRLNMLNDPNFQSLERNTFKQITKINDRDFSSIVWAYARNHEDQQGLLKRKLYDKINQVIIEELKFRIYRIQDKDLGLVLRGMKKLDLAKQPEKWTQVIQCLDKRLKQITDGYVIESVFQFLMCLPPTSAIINAVAKNIKKYAEYEWAQVSTLQSFVNTSGLLLLQNQKQYKSSIKQILVHQQANLQKILPQYSINNIPQFLTVLRQTETSLILPKTVNLCKKIIVENIKTQKQLIKQHSLYNLVGSFNLIDFQKYLAKSKSKFTQIQQKHKNYQADIRKYSIKALIPFQPIPYNSAQFFIYHDIAQLAYTQMHNIPNIFLAKLLEQLSLIRYKNQSLQDQIVTKIQRQIDSHDKTRFQLPTHNSQTTFTNILVSIINSYTFQKRYNQILQDSLDMLFDNKNYYSILGKLSPNILLRFIGGIVSVDAQHGQLRKQLIIKLFNNLIIPQIKSNQFIQQQLATICYIATMFNEYQIIDMVLQNKRIDNFYDPASKFIISFSSFISKINKQDENICLQKEEKKFQIAQQQFYSSIQQQISINQLSVGSPLPYKTVFKKIQQKLTQNGPEINGKKSIILKPWRIEDPNKKIVYFIATYDHLMVSPVSVNKQHALKIQENQHKTNKDQQLQKKLNLELFGVWRLYQRLYKITKWNMKIIVSFLEGK